MPRGGIRAARLGLIGELDLVADEVEPGFEQVAEADGFENFLGAGGAAGVDPEPESEGSVGADLGLDHVGTQVDLDRAVGPLTGIGDAF